MYQELHVVPDYVILLLVLLESILLPVQHIPLNPTDEAEAVLVLFQALLLLSNLGKLVDDNGTNDLVHDHLDDEQVAEIHQHIPKRNSREISSQVVLIIGSDKPCVCFKPNAQCKYKTVIQCCAVGTEITTVAVVEVEDGCEDISENEVDEKDNAQLIHGLLDGLQDDKECLASSKKLQDQHERVEEGVEYT